MAATGDILTDETGDILFTNGDVSWGDGTKQHQKEIVMAKKGSHKRAPGTGVNVINYLNGEVDEDLLKVVRSEFVSDGMTVNQIYLEANKLKFNAHY